MKKILSFIAAFTAVFQFATAQNIGINTTGAAPASSAMLDIDATNKGLLIPRIALTSADDSSPVISPVVSLMVYNTASSGTAPNDVEPGYYYWNGAVWIPFTNSISAAAWALGGNALSGNRNFGTTTNYPIPFIADNIERMRLFASGSLALGATSLNVPNPEKFLVDAGVTSSVNAIVAKGTIDNYLRMNIQNLSDGPSASSNFVATADNGSEATNSIDMGINGSTFATGLMGEPNDAYLYTTGQDLLLGTAVSTKSIVFITGGTSKASDEKMRINGSGLVGIGNNTPTERLDVTGNLKLSGAFKPDDIAGDLGFILTSNGEDEAPTWKAPVAALGLTPWALNGNAVASTSSLGTTSAFDLPFITTNTEKMRLFASGGLAIGATALASPNPEKLLVSAGTTTSVNAIVATGSINNYLQINVKNGSGGTAASSDLVATANNGSETANYIDMGINGSGNASTVMGDANDAYLYNLGQDLLIGTGTAGKTLVFMTGGTSQLTNERMRIGATGLVGIGVITPAQKLDVAGNFKLTGAFMPAGAAGTAGQLLSSTGLGTSPTWLDAPSVVGGIAWSLGGNILAAEQKLGPISNHALPFITNNTEKMRLFSNGALAIGATVLSGSQPEKLLVNAGTTSSYNLISARGSINNYLQLNVQNTSSGVSASSDLVATADNGDETVNFVDLGINSSLYSGTAILGGANNAYLYSTGNDFVIGNATAAKSLLFFTGGTAGANERMTITGTGNVGIGINTPNSTLTVNGSLTMKYRSGSGAYTLLDTDHVVINTGSAASWTLPAAAAGNAGRIYRLINQGTGSITLTQSVTTANATSTTTLPAGATGNFEIISDGSAWRKIN